MTTAQLITNDFDREACRLDLAALMDGGCDFHVFLNRYGESLRELLLDYVPPEDAGEIECLNREVTGLENHVDELQREAGKIEDIAGEIDDALIEATEIGPETKEAIIAALKKLYALNFDL